jgi:hypothetical protein
LDGIAQGVDVAALDLPVARVRSWATATHDVPRRLRHPSQRRARQSSAAS